MGENLYSDNIDESRVFGEKDEYYGSGPSREAYEILREMYQDEEIMGWLFEREKLDKLMKLP